METVKLNDDPKEEKILNKDDSLTNIESKNSVETSEQPKPEKENTSITSNDASGETTDGNTSNKGQRPSGENL